MDQSDFVHLHMHTQYSLLDGAIQIDQVLSEAKKYGMPALAITDHGNMFGAIDFYQKARSQGIKPIIGSEVYIAPGSRLDRTPSSDVSHSSFHLILLAKDLVGYRNLIKLISYAQTEGFYYKPRIDKELLLRYREGLVALSSCMKGEVSSLISRGMHDEAECTAIRYEEIMGKGNYFLEIQDNGIEEQKTLNRELIRISKKLSIPLVATNDCHYLKREDSRAHDILLCLQTGKTISDTDRLKMQTDQFYFKSPAEMKNSFKDVPEAIANTRRIADMVSLDLTFGKFHLPQYSVPEGYTKEGYMEELTRKGLKQRLSEKVGDIDPKLYEDRLDIELNIINKMGYAGYFLIVWDIVNHAKSSGIPVGPGRGSAAGSLVAFSLRITDIDPLAYGLIFERFLNPERITLPDIDIDFCMERRDEVIAHVIERFGSDHVSQIITFGTMAAKGAIRDVGRALEIPYIEVDKVAKLVPNTLNITIDEAIDAEPKLRELIEQNQKISELISIAKELEGLTRHASTHAAGIVISDAPIMEHLPLYRGTKGEIVTQYSMEAIEKIGLIKFDFLGLKTLTVIDKAVKLINKGKQDSLMITDIPLDDKETYRLLSSGDTAGVFQLESSGMRDILTKMGPERFEEIIAILALYRPGPIGSGMIDDFIKRKRGDVRIEYETPDLKDILEETYGVMVYQEQVMKVANLLAGFSLGDADILRRAMGKKKPEEMARQKEDFIKGAIKRGIDEKKAEKIFDQMAYFAGYGFNKSHSAAYALISYQTAYLKAHYPVEFMTAMLSSEMGNSDKIVGYIRACRDMGIAILPPDVNESYNDFTAISHGIRFGLAAIKNVGSIAIESIITAREEGGRFKSIFDFCRRVDLRKVNRRVIEGLIKSGAFDSTGAKRSQLMEVMERAMEEGVTIQRERTNGQINIFSPSISDGPDNGSFAAEEKLPDMPEWDETQILRNEKESVGFYVTSHPLARYESELKRFSVSMSEDVGSMPDGSRVTICGIIGGKKVINTKRGEKMAYVQVEDLHGSFEVIIFPELFKKVSTLILADAPLLVSGWIDRGEKGAKIRAKDMELLSDALLKPVSRVDISLNSEGIKAPDLINLKKILCRYQGDCLVYLRIHHPDQHESVIAVDENLKVSPTDSFVLAIETSFGKGTVSFT
ncbi:MAG: DNA polymerase III subunit alpha [Nitrospirae bacterium]|nr:DNA polymerase III subunit alpha [Nitrospirota bacterium]